ncbi:predicted protein [Uncinocarpus reesii 1704]|uniref:C2H2 type master regulator of conidiophore development brlA n=1 Tax=Uncinocarpus reesii (strain UAMH 1704) TaxID=336963 RepID=C4JKM9_UNCRE|nr:uncharacterized protein UREG_00326 [Uncinocarpus reesii 1704]EEP75480.1 predicted protein [Uncinocarpus reesii 1704]
MDLNSRDYSGAPQQYCSSYRSTMHASPYPTPPQTHAHTQPLSSHTPAMVGLELLDCHPNQQLPICTQPLLPASVSWPNDPSATQCYSSPSPNLGDYQGLGIYGSIDAIATTSSPFITPNTDVSVPNTMTFLSPPSMTRKPANVTYQRAPVLADIGLQYPEIPAHRQSTTSKRMKITHDEGTGHNAVQRTPVQQLALPYSYETGYTSPAEPNRVSANTLLELDNNIKRPAVNRRLPRETRPSSNNTNTATQVTCSTATFNNEVRKQPPKAVATAKGKFECPTCGMQFTRNSNCKSHMKIHDPNRKFPHKCTVGQCTKQFSRKTDLVRHVDSPLRRWVQETATPGSACCCRFQSPIN